MLQRFKHDRPCMIHFPFPHSIIGALLLMALNVPAAGAVSQCIDDAGSVTYTDQSCHAEARAVDAGPASGPRPVKAKVINAVNNYSAAEEARRVAWAMPRAPQRSLEPDISTLKAARLSMSFDDQARRLARQQASLRSKL
ncbi:DUF4124 domain-containing protein [Janthinobacterium sp. 17J80-10]|nr:DUF4124 domain-containing protein [Janthinobacterium sp. 17J80-10]